MKRFKSLVLTCFFITSVEVFATPQNDILLLMGGDKDAQSIAAGQRANIATDTNMLLIDAVQQYQFKAKFVPQARLERSLHASENVCATNRIKTPQRIKKYLFSTPLNLYLGQRLYSLGSANKLPPAVLDEEGRLHSLNALFKHYPRKMLAINQGRSFGEKIDAQITKLPAKNRILLGGSQANDAIFQMLIRKRIDYQLEYPAYMKSLIRANKQPVKLQVHEINGLQPYIIGYVNCPKSEQGKQVIEAVNWALQRLYQNQAFHQAHIRYIDPIDRVAFDRYFAKVFLPVGD